MDSQGAEETVTTPTSPEEIKANEGVSPSLPASEAEPVTNGEADIAKPTTEVPKENDCIESKPVEQPTGVESKVLDTKPVEPPVEKEEIKVEEPKAEGEVAPLQPKQEESTVVKADENVVAEPKEVIATSEVSEVTDEKRHDTNEMEASSVPTTVEE